MAQKGDGYHS